MTTVSATPSMKRPVRHNMETPLLTMYPYHGNLRLGPYQQARL